MLDVSVIKGYILSFGIWAPIVSFSLMIFQSIAAPLPAFLITFANAGLFGFIKGAMLSWISAMAGATLCFYIAKFYGRDVVEKLTSKLALESIDEFFDKYGKYAILIARLLPFMSFDIVSYAAGLTSMSFWSFFLATGLGQLPATIIYSYVGGMLVGGVKKFVFGLLMLFAMSILIFLLKKIWNEKKVKKHYR
ncbi:MAG: TVP38/TMEM64 family protein [Firmicutes bacterium]|nr:TVP38/TMEM64 family protein [Bacillota bacterium]